MLISNGKVARKVGSICECSWFRYCPNPHTDNNNKKNAVEYQTHYGARTRTAATALTVCVCVPRVFMTFMLIMLTPQEALGASAETLF